MTSADGRQLCCFKCGKAGTAPKDLMSYYTLDGPRWAHPLCMPVPELDLPGWDANGSPAR